MYLQHRRSWLCNAAAANMRIDARRLRPSKTSRRVNAGSTVRLEEMRCWATPSAMHWICMVFPSLAPQWLWGGSVWPNFCSALRLTMDRVRGLHRVWGLDSMSPFRDLPLPRLPLVSVRCLAQGQGHGVLERRPSRLAPARQSHWGEGGVQQEALFHIINYLLLYFLHICQSKICYNSPCGDSVPASKDVLAPTAADAERHNASALQITHRAYAVCAAGVAEFHVWHHGEPATSQPLAPVAQLPPWPVKLVAPAPFDDPAAAPPTRARPRRSTVTRHNKLDLTRHSLTISPD